MAWTSPSTWAAGAVLTAAQLNQQLRDNLKAIGDPWTAYTPALSTWTLGNGTLVGRYTQAGKLIHFSIEYTVGSTDTKSGSITLSLPVAARLPAHAVVGWAGLRDISAPANQARTARLATSTTFNIGPDEAGGFVTNLLPWTWATGDLIFVNGTYEAA